MISRISDSGFATVAASLALFLALTGGAVWAAGKVGSKDIKKNAVLSKHIKKNQITAKHIKKNQVDGSKIPAGAIGAEELAANSVGASEVAPNALGGAQIDESSLTGVDAASVNGVEDCRTRKTITVGPGTLDSVVACQIDGWELELSCEADGSALAATSVIELSPPQNNSSVAVGGHDKDGETDIAGSDNDVDASDSMELFRTSGFSGGPDGRSPAVSVIASTPGGKILSGQLSAVTLANGSNGSCMLTAELRA